MRIVSLIVRQGGGKALPHVLEPIANTHGDLIGLQEIRESTVATWRTSREHAWYEVADTFAVAK